MAEHAAPSNPERMTLEWLPGRFVVCRFAHDRPLPRWIAAALEAPEASLICLTRLAGEIALVIDEGRLPADLDPATPMQRGFIALRIAGIVDFTLIGVFAQLTGVLAAAGVSVFLISTYDTDVIMVREGDRERATQGLRGVAKII